VNPGTAVIREIDIALGSKPPIYIIIPLSRLIVLWPTRRDSTAELRVRIVHVGNRISFTTRELPPREPRTLPAISRSR
jgi:hypothetical protein